jgi:hypothetical protein
LPHLSIVYTIRLSVGRIDDAGYIVLFGNGHCEVRTGNGELIGIIPKWQAMYRVIQNTEKPLAYIADVEEVTQSYLIGSVALKKLVGTSFPSHFSSLTKFYCILNKTGSMRSRNVPPGHLSSQSSPY